MGTDIIANDVNHSNLGWGGLIHVFREGDEFLLPFTSEALTCDMPGSCIEGGKEVKGSSPSVPMFDFVGFLIELLVVKWVDTISFLILTVMSLFDVLVGFTVTIPSARRNITLDNG